MNLRPYQKAAFAEIKKTIGSGNNTRNLIAHACGTGKTVLIAQTTRLCKELGKRVLTLSPREHLMDQIEKQMNNAGISVAREQANRHAGLFDEYVLGSTMTMKGKRLTQWDPNAFDVILADECHLAHGNNTYASILKYFTSATVIGFTATPHLEQTRWKYVHEYPFPQGVEDGYLAEPVLHVLPLSFSLKEISKVGGDYNASQLDENLIEMIRLNSPLISMIAKHMEGQTIVFTPGIKGTEAIAAGLRALGIRAEAYHSKMGAKEKKVLREKMDSGEIRVIVNPASLIHGYDLGSIQTVVIARPTLSFALLMQMIGRGSRMKGTNSAGKFKIIEFEKDAAAKDALTARDIIFDPKMPKNLTSAIQGFLKRFGKDKNIMGAFRAYRQLLENNMLEYVVGLAPISERCLLNLDRVLEIMDAVNQSDLKAGFMRQRIATPKQLEALDKWGVYCPRGNRTTMGEVSDFMSALQISEKKERFLFHRSRARECHNFIHQVVLPEIAPE